MQRMHDNNTCFIKWTATKKRGSTAWKSNNQLTNPRNILGLPLANPCKSNYTQTHPSKNPSSIVHVTSRDNFMWFANPRHNLVMFTNLAFTTGTHHPPHKYVYIYIHTYVNIYVYISIPTRCYTVIGVICTNLAIAWRHNLTVYGLWQLWSSISYWEFLQWASVIIPYIDRLSMTIPYTFPTVEC